jgi:hypothetical protein
MVIDQRNSGSQITPNGQYTLDRWYFANSQTGKFTLQQNAGSVTTPVGFPNYLGLTSTSTYSIGSTDYFAIVQFIEGFNFADFAFGTANAKTLTLSFVVYSSLSGTFGGSVKNFANSRSYPFTYTISSANTWTTISVTIPGDTSGTWVGATSAGAAQVYFGLGVGSTYSGAAGSWSSNNYLSATGATSVVGTNGATFYITGVQLEQGSVATPFERPLISKQVADCERYYFNSNGPLGGVAAVNAGGYNNFYFPVTMRAVPTVALTGGGTFSGTTIGYSNFYTQNTNTVGFTFTASAEL